MVYSLEKPLSGRIVWIFMLREPRFLMMVCSLLLSVCCTYAMDADELPSVSELQRAYIEANGGLSNILGLTSIVASGVVTFENGENKEFTLYLKRPDRMRLQIAVEPGDYSKIFDGRDGYEVITNVEGATTVRPVTGQKLEELRHDANLDGRFFRLRDKVDSLEVVALVEVDGEPAYEISINDELNFDYNRIWIHQEYLYEMKMSRTIKNAAGELITEELRMSEFEPVRGVWAARKISRYYDDRLVQVVDISNLRSNVGLFDSLFEKPESE